MRKPSGEKGELFASMPGWDAGLIATRLGTVAKPMLIIQSIAAAEGGPNREVTRHAPPALGEHSAKILREAGFDPADIDALLAAGVVYQAPPIGAQEPTTAGVAQ